MSNLGLVFLLNLFSVQAFAIKFAPCVQALKAQNGQSFSSSSSTERKSKFSQPSDEFAGPRVSKAEQKRNSKVEQEIKNSPEFAQAAQDLLNYNAITDLDKNDIATLLIGSPGVRPSKADIELGLSALKEYVDRGYYIFLDGHSAVTPTLLQAAGGQAIAITTHLVEDIPEEQQVVITNQYFYMRALKHAVWITGSQNSTTAISMALYEELDSFLGEKIGDFRSLKEWLKTSAGWNVGVKSWAWPNHFISPLTFARKNLPVFRNFNPKTDAFKPLSYQEFSKEDVKFLIEHVNHMVKGFKETQGPQAVVFGSSGMNESSKFIYKVAYELAEQGFGVATGGAGGAMLAANMGAYDAGGVSLGVPLVEGKLKTESKTFSDVQTKTVGAEDYYDRIPWLLNGRKIIVIAPGGTGTMREIVASLLQLSASKDPDAVMIFLNTEFYGPLVKWIKSLPISRDLKSRLFVIDNLKELNKVISYATSQQLISELQLQPPQKTRGDKKTLSKIESNSSNRSWVQELGGWSGR